MVKAIPDRTQTVIRRGPYSIVRHPLYAVDLLFLVSISLFLGSWWGLAATVGLSIPFIARTALEDRELRRNLQGYADYADQVRFRLLPYVW